MTDALAGVREASDPECVHRLRVATRRLRAGLALFGECLPLDLLRESRRRLRRLTRALGEARDLDVQILGVDACRAGARIPAARPGLRRLQLRLEQRRRALQPRVIKVVDQFERSAVVARLARHLERRDRWRTPEGVVRVTGPLLDEIRRPIRERLEEVRALESFVGRAECVDELHKLRIAVKRLRYTVEALRPVHVEASETALRELRRLQTRLGDIHDDDVWLEFLPRFLEEEQTRMIEFLGHARGFTRIVTGVEAFRRERQAARRLRHRQWIEHWTSPAAVEVLARLESGALLCPLDQEVPL